MRTDDFAAQPPPRADLVAAAPRVVATSRAVALVVWDALAPALVFLLVVAVTGADLARADRVGGVPIAVLVADLVALPALLLAGAYGRSLGAWAAFRPVIVASAACALVVAYADARFGTGVPADATLVTFLALPLAWSAPRLALRLGRRAERVVVIGAGRVALRLAQLADRHRDARLEIVGCLDDDRPDAPASVPWLGRIGDLTSVLSGGGVDRVVVAFTRHRDEEIARIIQACDERGVEVDVVPRLFDLMPPAPRAYGIGELSLLRLGGRRPGRMERVGKRAFDTAAAGLLLLVFAPVMAVCALAILITSGRPVLFQQERVGRDLRPFRILKFRTMVRDADAMGLERIRGLADGRMDIAEAVAALKPASDPRVTRVGGWLRRTSLDELPQLWNVLVGDMSIVGPRPLRRFECDSLSGWELRRQGVRPGITGLWQVTSRSDADWAERMRLDYRYVRHWSLGDDLRILARTVAVVLARKGAV